jgi:hypothetical protein
MIPDDKALWEILVPRYSNIGQEYKLEYHRAWDACVRDIAGGITSYALHEDTGSIRKESPSSKK